LGFINYEFLYLINDYQLHRVTLIRVAWLQHANPKLMWTCYFMTLHFLLGLYMHGVKLASPSNKFQG
jgi:hypothetical protein